jgi:organic hydroperoxide reductase OsmC/OhrA
MSTSHHFKMRTVRQTVGRALVEAEGRPTFIGGAPPEFGGSGEVWSPEHLLIASAALCFLSTFEWFARRAEVHVAAMSVEADGEVDRIGSGLGFTQIRLLVHLHVGAGETARTRELVERTERSCLVSRSLRAPVEIELDLQEAAAAA